MDQYRLRSRVRPIPNGLRFAQPELKWDSVKALGKFPSWEQMVQAIIAVRAANPAQLEKHGWSLDTATVADELDQYNTRICLSTRGWEGFVRGPEGESPPKLPPPGSLVSNLQHAAVGGKVLVEWIESGAQAVPIQKAIDRAKVCSICPLNGSGGLLKYFTVPVSEAIRAAVSKRAEWKLETRYDDQLGVCTACDCPLKLKVHMPIENILTRLKQEQMTKLHPNCWILTEMLKPPKPNAHQT
jgi:hypothetical protein